MLSGKRLNFLTNSFLLTEPASTPPKEAAISFLTLSVVTKRLFLCLLTISAALTNIGSSKHGTNIVRVAAIGTILRKSILVKTNFNNTTPKLNSLNRNNLLIISINSHNIGIERTLKDSASHAGRSVSDWQRRYRCCYNVNFCL